MTHPTTVGMQKRRNFAVVHWGICSRLTLLGSTACGLTWLAGMVPGAADK